VVKAHKLLSKATDAQELLGFLRWHQSIDVARQPSFPKRSVVRPRKPCFMPDNEPYPDPESQQTNNDEQSMAKDVDQSYNLW